MTHEKLIKWYKKEIEKHTYKRYEYENGYKLDILDFILYKYPRGKAYNKKSINDCIITLDTETSKTHQNIKDKATNKYIPVTNYIVRWAITVMSESKLLFTILGKKPSDCINLIGEIQTRLKGERTNIFVHNLAYDWQFLRKFFFKKFGYPVRQLNTKPHYQVHIEFSNGISLRDTLIIGQRKLEKWANDLEATPKKVGFWDYEKIRNQNEVYTEEENEYQEGDTTTLAECLDIFCRQINKTYTSIPFTQTGVCREIVKTTGLEHNAKQWFNKNALTFKQYLKFLHIFHGGYTHGNRFIVGWVLNEKLILCFDFASSYPYCLLAFKYPSSKFIPFKGELTPDELVKYSEKYAFMFKVKFFGARLKNKNFPMPPLQFSKALESLNCVLDNGKILTADYLLYYMNELDFALIYKYYEFDKIMIEELEYAGKDYLPRWLTDLIFDQFKKKCELKGKDKVQYNISKANLNAMSFGIFAQRSLMDDIIENYEDGKFKKENKITEKEYDKYLKKETTILPYQIGAYITSRAMSNLFELGECCNNWIYSDTDSIYSDEWDIEKVNKYNEKVKNNLLKNNYGAVNIEGKEYWLGIAEHSEKEDTFKEFITVGAKRYAKRNLDDEITITVAGVPKNKGAIDTLENSLYNFKEGLIFKGEETGKKTHSYLYVDDIYIDNNGNEIGDSIDLFPCDYELSTTEHFDLEELEEEEIKIQVYE